VPADDGAVGPADGRLARRQRVALSNGGIGSVTTEKIIGHRAGSPSRAERTTVTSSPTGRDHIAADDSDFSQQMMPDALRDAMAKMNTMTGARCRRREQKRGDQYGHNTCGGGHLAHLTIASRRLGTADPVGPQGILDRSFDLPLGDPLRDATTCAAAPCSTCSPSSPRIRCVWTWSRSGPAPHAAADQEVSREMRRLVHSHYSGRRCTGSTAIESFRGSHGRPARFNAWFAQLRQRGCDEATTTGGERRSDRHRREPPAGQPRRHPRPGWCRSSCRSRAAANRARSGLLLPPDELKLLALGR
jgi:hypothetical protein